MKFHQILSLLTLVATTNVVVDARISTANIFNEAESENDRFASTGAATKGRGRGRGDVQKEDPEEDVQIIVKYKDDIGRDDLKGESNRGDLDNDFPEFHIAAITTKRKNLNHIMHDPHIESFSESRILTKLGWPDEIDDKFDSHMRSNSTNSHLRQRQLAESTPYGITMVQADDAFFLNNQRPDTTVKVCVVDTGYDEDHEDLPGGGSNGGQPVDGYSPYSGQTWNNDGDGHGTHCAGTIGAVGNNNLGVTSCNPNPDDFSFYIGKGLTDSGSGSSAGVLAAVQRCAASGAKVISMSLGGGGYSIEEDSVYQQLYNDGVLVIAAAGNAGDSTLSYPASYPTVMSVAAVDSNMNRVGFSQYNSQVEIAAPGAQVRSTIPNDGYASWSGTSMATPHVAGVAALVWSYFPECSNNQIRNVLIKTAIDRGSSGCDQLYGHGVVQAKAAYDLLAAQGCDAGGIDFPFKLDGAPGGCEQGDSYVPPPPPEVSDMDHN